MSLTGILLKMKTHWESAWVPVRYDLRLSEISLVLNEHLGKRLTLTHTGHKQCIACARKISKTFQQGYCFPCTQKLAETDLCIVKPELCHFHKGTCRDNDFAAQHCFIRHCVYLSVTSHAKVGITRESQKLNRWADQGASLAIELAHVENRKTAGEIEVHLAQNISDKTNWRKMLMGQSVVVDLLQLKKTIAAPLFEFENITQTPDTIYALTYPVLAYPQKITSLSFDKTATIEDELLGIKGQYLLFKNGVLNVRAHQGYEVIFNTLSQ